MEKTGQEQTATFAGGCFWCTESAFDGQKGVIRVVSGYIGGQLDNPTYGQVCSGTSGHYEAVQVSFDPDVISYDRLLEIFFKQIDPSDDGGSFLDRGPQYRSAVFYHTSEQKNAARKAIERINQSGLFDHPVATRLIEAVPFFEAETYHQGYHKNHADRYRLYRAGSGRDAFIHRYRNDYKKIFKPDQT